MSTPMPEPTAPTGHPSPSERPPASDGPTGSGTSADHLGTGLRTRHLTMMGLGSAIGAGLFLGSGVGIATAGPAVLVSYAIAGVVVILVCLLYTSPSPRDS